MHRKIFILAAFFIFSGNLFGQAVSSITGTIQDKTTKLPIEFATVQLLQLPDSIVLKTTVTDKKGNSLLKILSRGIISSAILLSDIVRPFFLSPLIRKKKTWGR